MRSNLVERGDNSTAGGAPLERDLSPVNSAPDPGPVARGARAGSAGSGLLPLDLELAARVTWFVRLRWGMAALLIAVALLHRWPFGWPLPVGALGVGLALLGVNALFTWQLHVLRPQAPPPRSWSRVIRLQLFVDLLALTVLIHFTGGPCSPLLPFYAVPIVICSLLLHPREVLVTASWAIGLVLVQCGLAWYDLLPFRSLGGVLPEACHGSALSAFLALGISGLIATVALLVSNLGRTLRRREQQLLQAQVELQEAFTSLEELSRSRTSYARTVTHELRTPLAVIQTSLEATCLGAAGPVPPRAQELLERGLRQTHALTELVSEMLELTRDQPLRPVEPTSSVAVVQLFQQALDQFEALAERKGVRFSVALPGPGMRVQGEATDLYKVLANLVSNAIKYTLRDGEVRLSARVEPGWIVLEVQDTGIGIPEAEHGCLFVEFYRATNARQLTAEPSSGLGLVIARRLIEEQRGRLRFTSAAGRGTTFWIDVLPAAEGVPRTSTHATERS